MGFAIAVCEIGFWLLLAAGLGLRYGLRLRTASTAVLLAVPLVDVALLAFTAVDLHRGATPDAGHGLAAVYLGFSIAFGHGVIVWADRRVAHRFAGGPPPPPKPAAGTLARRRREYRDFGLALLGYAVAAAVAGLLALTVRDGDTVTPLFGFLPGLTIALVVWFLGWVLPEALRRRS